MKRDLQPLARVITTKRNVVHKVKEAWRNRTASMAREMTIIVEDVQNGLRTVYPPHAPGTSTNRVYFAVRKTPTGTTYNITYGSA